MGFVPDFNIARKCLDENIDFGPYSRAYAITNENLRESMKHMPLYCDRALTVAASGDHPLFCSLYGAKYVDTFDISYNAKCIMDIKVAALNFADNSYSKYCKMFFDLFFNGIRRTNYLSKLSEKLPRVEYSYIYKMSNHNIFSMGAYPGNNARYLPTKEEYEKLHAIVQKTYAFIMTDVANLCNCLTEKYDFIHLSNILDYIPKHKHTNTITPLLDYVNVHGRILMLDEIRLNSEKEFGFADGPTCSDSCKTIAMIYNDWRFIEDTKNHINILERFR